MSNQVGQAWFGVGLDIDDLQRGLSQLDRLIDQELRKMVGSFEGASEKATSAVEDGAREQVAATSQAAQKMEAAVAQGVAEQIAAYDKLTARLVQELREQVAAFNGSAQKMSGAMDRAAENIKRDLDAIPAHARRRGKEAVAGFEAELAKLEKGVGGRFGAGLDFALQARSSKFADQAQLVQGGLQGAGMAGTALSAGLLFAAKDAFDATVGMDRLNQMLVTTMGSAEAARAEMVELRKVAELPGVDLKQSVQLSVSMQQIGYSAAESRRMISEWSNELAKFGGGAVEFERMAVNLQQIAGMGKLTGDELREMGALIPSLRGKLVELYGTMDTQELAKGGLTGKQFIQDMTDALSKLPRAPFGTLRNDIDNLMQDLEMLKAEAGELFAPMAREFIATARPMMRELAEWFDSLDEGQKRFYANLLLGGAAFGPVTLAASQFVGVAANVVIGFRTMQAAQAAAAAATAASGASAVAAGGSFAGLAAVLANPVTIAIAGVTLAAWGLKSAYDHVASEGERYTKQLEEEWQAQVKATDAKLSTIKAVKPLIQEYLALRDSTKQSGDKTERMSRLLDMIAAQAPDVVSGFDSQGRAIGLVTDAMKALGDEAEETRKKLIQSAIAAFEAQAAGAQAASVNAGLAVNAAQDRFDRAEAQAAGWRGTMDGAPQWARDRKQVADAELRAAASALAQAKLASQRADAALAEAVKRGRDAARGILRAPSDGNSGVNGPEMPPGMRRRAEDAQRQREREAKKKPAGRGSAARAVEDALNTEAWWEALGARTPTRQDIQNCANYVSRTLRAAWKDATGGVPEWLSKDINWVPDLQKALIKAGAKAVSAAEAKPGDVVFTKSGVSNSGLHTGLFTGRDKSGNPLMSDSNRSTGKRFDRRVPKGAMILSLPPGLRDRISPDAQAAFDQSELAIRQLEVAQQAQDALVASFQGLVARDVTARAVASDPRSSLLSALGLDPMTALRDLKILQEMGKTAPDAKRLYETVLELGKAAKAQANLEDAVQGISVGDVTSGWEQMAATQRAFDDLMASLEHKPNRTLSLEEQAEAIIVDWEKANFRLASVEREAALRQAKGGLLAKEAEEAAEAVRQLNAEIERLRDEDMAQQWEDEAEALKGLSQRYLELAAAAGAISPGEMLRMDLETQGFSPEAIERLAAQEDEFRRMESEIKRIQELADLGAAGIREAFDGLFDGKNPFQSLSDFFRQTLQDMAGALLQSEVRGWLQNLLGIGVKGLSAAQMGQGAAFGQLGGPGVGALDGFGGFLAGGGPAKAGVPYIVGEEGPELMVPISDGLIIPHRQTSRAVAALEAGSGQVNNISINIAVPQGADSDAAFLPNLRAAVSRGVQQALRQAQRSGG